jgi:hypothetical protein
MLCPFGAFASRGVDPAETAAGPKTRLDSVRMFVYYQPIANGHAFFENLIPNIVLRVSEGCAELR